MPTDLVLRLPPSETPPSGAADEAYLGLAARELGLRPDQLSTVRPTRVSFDARRRGRGWRLALRAWEVGEEVPPDAPSTPPTFDRPRSDAPHVVVVGSGPAGLFCALDLLAGGVRVTVLERGRDVQTRRKPIARLNRGQPADPDCNYCFGEGGAGTYSDGKLYTRSSSKRAVRSVLETLVAHGAPRDILVSWRPHVGSNRLPQVVQALRETILRSGGEVLFGHRAEAIETRTAPGESAAEQEVSGIVARELDTDRTSRLDCDAVVLATGHSALDALRMAAAAGAPLEPKGFAMGVRIEHPQPWLDERQYGGLRSEHDLPASFYELTTQSEGRGVYSFCMCPGGFIVPATTAPDRVVVNGMSLSRRDSPFANSGLVVALEPEDWSGNDDHGWLALLERARAAGMSDAPQALPSTPEEDPLFGVRLQLALETVACAAGRGGNRSPSQRADLFLADGARPGEAIETSYRPGVRPCDLGELLPVGMTSRLRAALRDFDGRLPGYAGETGQLLGVESRTSSPVRIQRDRESFESPGVAGLYPAGEGAGFAGGIVSAAIDGQRVAAALLTRVHAV